MRKLDSVSQADGRDDRSEWRSVTMPFDVPLMSVSPPPFSYLFILSLHRQIINRVQIHPHLDPAAPKYAGQPIDVTLTITSSFHWSGSSEARENEHTMRYDVACEMDSGWLVCGPKRGEYIAQV
jgi:hypothetical protein